MPKPKIIKFRFSIDGNISYKTAEILIEFMHQGSTHYLVLEGEETYPVIAISVVDVIQYEDQNLPQSKSKKDEKKE